MTPDVDQESHPESTPRYQFGLLSLVLWTTGLSVWLAVVVWLGVQGGIVALLIVTIALLLAAMLRTSSRLGAAGGVALVVTLLFAVFFKETPWSGLQHVAVRVRVVDAASGLPVPGAVVKLLSTHPWADSATSTDLDLHRTDTDGTAELDTWIRAAGLESALGRDGDFHVDDQLLRVRAPGYRDVNRPLRDFTGTTWDINQPRGPIVIRLQPGRDDDRQRED